MTFIDEFSPDLTVESPGRINLIGEHTDYNLGFVMPTGFDKKIILKFRKNGSTTECKVHSLNNNETLLFSLTNIAKSPLNWENYILGVMHELLNRTTKIAGFDCIIQSNLPIGSGLSSSAALECGLVSGLNALFDLGLSKEDIVVLSRAAEHNYVGTKCGIMDQYASVMSKPGFVIMLDCRSLESKYIPLNLHDYKLLLLNTNISHSLADSEYNTRLHECLEGLKMIQQIHPNSASLRDVTKPMLDEIKQKIDSVIYDRCEYIIEENDRVIAASNALKNDDLVLFGKLMYGSHDGLQHKYQVSCPELDFLVDYSRDKEFILGSRMMGGGFGGCTINLIHKDVVEAYTKEVSQAYLKRFNIDLDAYLAMPDSGTIIKKQK